MEKVIIIGTGCAGLTAAVYAARANIEPLVIEGKQPGGQLTTTSEVENFPGFPEGIDGYTLMDSMRKQAQRFGARFESDTIEDADFSGPVKKLITKNKTYEAKTVIIATGAAPRFLSIPGEQEFFGGKGVSTCAVCDGAFYRDQEVVVIGGGDSACEEAIFLTHFCKKVTLIHRRDQLRASPIMAKRALAHEKITPLWDSIPEAFIGDEKDGITAVQVKNVKTNEVSEVPCKAAFIAIGHNPNTAPFAKQLKLDENKYIIPENGSMVKTAFPGVYVAGDCADHLYRQAITAAGMGCQAALESIRWLEEQEG